MLLSWWKRNNVTSECIRLSEEPGKCTSRTIERLQPSWLMRWLWFYWDFFGVPLTKGEHVYEQEENKTENEKKGVKPITWFRCCPKSHLSNDTFITRVDRSTRHLLVRMHAISLKTLAAIATVNSPLLKSYTHIHASIFNENHLLKACWNGHNGAKDDVAF